MPLTFPRRGRRLLGTNKHSRSLCILKRDLQTIKIC